MTPPSVHTEEMKEEKEEEEAEREVAELAIIDRAGSDARSRYHWTPSLPHHQMRGNIVRIVSGVNVITMKCQQRFAEP